MPIRSPDRAGLRSPIRSWARSMRCELVPGGLRLLPVWRSVALRRVFASTSVLASLHADLVQHGLPLRRRGAVRGADVHRRLRMRRGHDLRAVAPGGERPRLRVGQLRDRRLRVPAGVHLRRGRPARPKRLQRRLVHERIPVSGQHGLQARKHGFSRVCATAVQGRLRLQLRSLRLLRLRAETQYLLLVSSVIAWTRRRARGKHELPFVEYRDHGDVLGAAARARIPVYSEVLFPAGVTSLLGSDSAFSRSSENIFVLCPRHGNRAFRAHEVGGNPRPPARNAAVRTTRATAWCSGAT